MNMETMNISLPESLKAFIESEVTTGGYSSASEFVRELVREAQKRKAREQLETLLLEGLNSGEPIEVTPKFWEEKIRQLQERFAKDNGT
jgi:antitoxin ParD1/3/4